MSLPRLHARPGRGGEQEGERAYPSDEHERHEDRLREGVQGRRDSQGEPHRTDGRGGLEEAGQERQPLEGADQHGADERSREVEHEQPRRGPDRLVGDATLEEDRVVAPARDSRDGGHEDGEGRRLHAARRGPRAAAHKHQEHHHHDAVLREAREVGRVEARGPRGDRLEERGQDALAEGQPRVGPEPEDEGGHPYQEGCGGEADLGLQAEAREREAVLGEVAPRVEADAADDDQGHDDEVDEGVCAVGGQRGELRPHAHEVETGVAEGRDRVEEGVPEAAHGSEVTREHEVEQGSARKLDSDDHLEDEEGHPDDACHVVARDGVLEEAPLDQRDLGPREDAHDEGRQDDAEAAHLDQGEDDGLAEAAPVGRRVLDDEARHAGGGYRGEEGVEVGGPLAVGARDGQGQDEPPEQDHPQEAEEDDLRRSEPPPFSCAHLTPVTESGRPHRGAARPARAALRPRPRPFTTPLR